MKFVATALAAAFTALGAAFIATVSASSGAQAAVIDFSGVALCSAPCAITYTGATLGTSSAINLGTSSWVVSGVGAGDDSGLTSPNSFTLNPTQGTYDGLSGSGLDHPLAATFTKTWTATVGPDIGDMFTETFNILDAVDRGTNAIAFTFTGTVSDSDGLFVDVPVDLVLSLTQSGGPGKVVSASLTNSTSAIPEPSTWAMMLFGFIGLAYAALRRSSKSRSEPIAI